MHIPGSRGTAKGVCRTGALAVVSSYGPHHGEENPLRGWTTSPNPAYLAMDERGVAQRGLLMCHHASGIRRGRCHVPRRRAASV
jgi:hypothetical protein